jgi:hypothetical protein
MINFSRKKIISLLTFSIVPNLTFFSGIFGYYLCKFLSGEKPGKQGKIKSLIFSFKNWRIHLHHWFLGTVFLLFSIFFDFLVFSQFSLGFLFGIIFQGFTYPDWYKIVDKIECQD